LREAQLVEAADQIRLAEAARAEVAAKVLIAGQIDMIGRSI
jgi:hypothetical protein